MSKKIWKRFSLTALAAVVAASLFLTVGAISGMGSESVQAAEIVASGACGESVHWTLDKDGLLTISGEGEMNNYMGFNDSPWYSYCDKITGLQINEGVTSIGDFAFSDCSSLTSITLPDGVTDIGNHAFAYCSSLTSITIPASVTSIEGLVFEGCCSLENIEIPVGVTTIGWGAFFENTACE